MIKWIDKKSTLFFKGKSWKAGELVPAGIIPEYRLKHFEKSGKIQIGEDKQNEDIAQVIKPVEEISPEIGEEKPKRIYKKRSIIPDVDIPSMESVE
jgi:hypothetical protein